MSDSVQQHVSVVDGFAYGAVGADLHVFDDGRPVYLLHAARPSPPAPSPWLRQLPSRLLNARQAVIRFTGRHAERQQLRTWLAEGRRMRACWLHGAGGQGKTRLAAKAAEDAAADGWLVVQAIPGAGAIHPPAGSQDLRLGSATGVLVIVDYADRWETSHLVHLVGNTLLHQPGVPARVLLIARTSDRWPALHTTLEAMRAELSSFWLQPLPAGDASRTQMFLTARDGFAQHYDLDPSAVAAPVLDHAEMGLTLAVHMAALVAVDAFSRGADSPSDLAGLTLYLLDRENLRWATAASHVDSHRPAAAMSQIVFLACLVGVQAHATGVDLAQRLLAVTDAGQAVADHTVCYPVAIPGAVFEPLYPDRLAEDFVALTLDGHTAEYPAGAWAGGLVASLCRREDDGGAPPWISRAMTMLAASAQRWPHVGVRHLYPIVKADPRLAVQAGGAALTTLVAPDGIETDLLAAIEQHLPRERHVDLDGAALALTRRLIEGRLAAAEDPQTRAGLHSDLGYRLSVAGRREEAAGQIEQSVALYRGLADGSAEPSADLAHELLNLCYTVSDLGRRNPALALAQDAVALYRRLAAKEAAYEEDLAYALNTLGTMLAAVGEYAEAVDAAEQAVELSRRLAVTGAEARRGDLAAALDNLNLWLSEMGLHQRALAAAGEATAVFRELAEQNPDRWLPDLAAVLTNVGLPLDSLGRAEESAAVMRESVEVYGRLAEIRPEAFEHHFATALSNLTSPLHRLGRHHEALESSRLAVHIRRRAAAQRPGVFEADLASALNNLSDDLMATGDVDAAYAAAEEAVVLRRNLVADYPERYSAELASALSNTASALLGLGRVGEAAQYADEALALYRRLRGSYPNAHTDRLAAVLSNVAQIRIAQDRPEAALAAIEESIALLEQDPGGADALGRAVAIRSSIVERWSTA